MEENQDKSPTFFFNDEKEPDPDYKSHFFATQIQTLLLAILITGLMQLSNHLAIYLFYCFPVYFFIVFLEFFMFWKPEADYTRAFNVYNIVMFIICCPVFYGIFFAIFHPTASVSFTEVQNCQLVGSFSDSIENTESYSILYVNFEYQGKEYLGAACSSSQSQGDIPISIAPYKFYYKFDSISCGPSKSDLTISSSSSNTPRNSTRILRTGGGGSSGGRSGGGGGSRSGGSTHHSSSSSSSGSSSCSRDYLWSKVKIASWLCMERGFDVEDYMEKQSCYMNFFSGQQAVQSGQDREPMRDQNNFPLISYQGEAYYPQRDLLLLICFTYYFWILSFNSISQYTANYILKSIRKWKLQRQTAIQQFMIDPPKTAHTYSKEGNVNDKNSDTSSMSRSQGQPYNSYQQMDQNDFQNQHQQQKRVSQSDNYYHLRHD